MEIALKKLYFMKRCLVVASVLLMPLGAFAADTGGIKMGVVNAVKVLESAPQAEEARKRLETEFAPRDRRLVDAQKALKGKEDKLSKDGAIMSETERRNLERDVLNGRRELKRDQDEFREDLNFRRNEEFGKIQRQVVEAIQSVAKEEGFDLVLGEGVIFANDKVDVTAKVVDRLKQSYKK
jgi:outer membrane protein